jgi:hypothetical protein
MRNSPEPGWLFLYILGGLPSGVAVLYVSMGSPPEPRSVQGYSWTEPGSPFSWAGALVGLVLITYFWWPAWIQRARYGKPGQSSGQTWDERIAERTEEAKRKRPLV